MIVIQSWIKTKLIQNKMPIQSVHKTVLIQSVAIKRCAKSKAKQSKASLDTQFPL